MADAGDVFGGAAEFHDGHGFRDQFRGHRAHDVHAQDFIGLGIGDHLGKAGGVAQRAGAAVGQEREAAGLVLAAFGLELLLGLADPGDFRRGVDDPRHGVEVDVAVLAGDALGNRHALFFGLVRQHRAAHHVAHRPDVRQVGLAVAVHGHEAAFVQLQAHGVGVQAAGVGHTADRDDQLVHDQLLLGALGVDVRHGHRLGGRLDLADLDAHLDVQALLGEGLQGFLGHLLVGGGQEFRHRFQDGDVGTQAAPHAAHFQADHASADDAQRLGHGADVQGAVVGQHDLFVERQAGQFTRRRARGDDDMLGDQVFLGGAGDLDGPAAFHLAAERALAVEERDLVLLEQVQDAVVVLLDHRVLAADQRVELQADALDFDAVLGEVVVGLLVVFGRLQQRLGRDAADVGAGAAGSRAALAILPGVDAGDRHAELRGADGGDVAAGACADHDDVKLFGHSVLANEG